MQEQKVSGARLWGQVTEQYHPEDVSPFVYAHHVVLVVYDKRETITLGELLPDWWGDVKGR